MKKNHRNFKKSPTPSPTFSVGNHPLPQKFSTNEIINNQQTNTDMLKKYI